MAIASDAGHDLLFESGFRSRGSQTRTGQVWRVFSEGVLYIVYVWGLDRSVLKCMPSDRLWPRVSLMKLSGECSY